MKRNYLNSEENPDYPYDTYKKWDNIPDCVDIHFYHCKSCGQIMAAIGDIDKSVNCCGSDMIQLAPCSIDASTDHHIPIFSHSGHKVSVRVGKVDHPMLEEHHIEWICLVTDLGIQWRPLATDSEPAASFRLKRSEQILAIYSYCNLHGLWCCKNYTEE